VSEQRRYAVAETATVVVSGDGRRIPVRVWYPAASPGRDQPFAGSACPAPAVSFGHGHLAPAGAYASLLARIAANGIVAIAPETERRLFPDHAAFARDLRSAVVWLASGAPGNAVLDGVVDPERLGVAGHSMGGGCAVLAAATDPRLRTVATTAAARTRPSAVEAAGRLRVPVLFVAAERDRVAPVGIHQRPLFEAVPEGTPAQLLVIRDGVHAGFVDPLGVWAALGAGPSALGRSAQLALTGELIVSWLLYALGCRDDLWGEVWGPAAAERVGVVLESHDPPSSSDPGAVDEVPARDHREDRRL
jgi:dienelactone hydrolase